MKLDLSELARTIGMHAVQEVDEQCRPVDVGFECVSPIQGELKFTNTGSLLLITGEVHTDVRLECSRCVTDFIERVDASIEEEFSLDRVGDSIQALPLEDDEISLPIITNNQLDVTELVRQNILVVLPIQPLCMQDCKGLCPTCGENLNVRQCPCPPAESESPFQALAELLEDEDNSE
jgi:uncharacterized protein